MISNTLYYVISAILVLMVFGGIFLLSKPKTATLGNLISVVAVVLAIVVTFIYYEIFNLWYLYISLGLGFIIGAVIAYKVKMIKMPDLIAILNGLGGLASLIVGIFALYQIGGDATYFSITASMLAIVIGSITFVGSIIAFLKLARLIPSKPIKIIGYTPIVIVVSILIIGFVFATFFIPISPIYLVIIGLLASIFLAVIATIAIGGADMPIAISLLNSFSGLAAAITGLAISELILVAFGSIVGASGLILTRIMSKAMNKSLLQIITGKTTTTGTYISKEVEESNEEVVIDDPAIVFKEAKKVIIVPGYGMAISQAQHEVRKIYDMLLESGKDIRFAIHPIAGRMPGHMNVLLAEVSIDYDHLYDLDDINDEFLTTDLVIVIGANDVINPASKTHEGTPIYGMPILNVSDSKHIFIFNYDLNPGYSGVENPLYKRKSGVTLFLGDAKDTLKEFIQSL